MFFTQKIYVNYPHLDATHLPIVPPMDLNHNMRGIDKISPFPMQLRTPRGIGLFGTRRGVDHGLISMHQAADLLAPIGTPVYAAASGTVIGGSESSVLILHDMGLKFLTFYQHLQNKLVGTDITVGAGEQIAEVGDWSQGSDDHLHFEIRYPFDTGSPSRGNSVPVDPTNVLYQWEVKTFQNDEAVRHVIENVSITDLEEVWRGRLLRFLLVNVSGNNRELFLPYIDSSPANQSMIETLKLALFHSKRVSIVWRESLFFSKIQTTHDKVAIIAEVKVIGDAASRPNKSVGKDSRPQS